MTNTDGSTSINIDKSLFSRSTKFVCAPDLQGRTYNIHLLFRAEFQLNTIPDHAVLRFYASGLTEIALNGKAFHQGPCRSCPPVLYYDEIEMNSLAMGKNVLVFHQIVESLDEETGIVCELELQRGGQTCYLLQEPTDYKVCLPDCYLSEVPKNYGTGYAEYLTLPEHDILSPDYQDNFQPAVHGKKLCRKEWWTPRPIPLFHENVIKPVTCTKEKAGTVLLDFSTMVFGRPELSGTGNGEICIEYIEDLNGGWISPKGTCVMYDDRIMNVYGAFRWKSFRKRSFRYVRLHHVGFENLDFRVNEYNYPAKEIGSFHSSDTFLNRLAKISIDTLKVCMDDFYNDCPHRDQAQWMDAYASAQAALGLFGVSDLTRKCIIQYGLCSVRKGRIVSPSLTGRASLTDYSFVFFCFVQWYYHVSGDKELVQLLYQPLREILASYRQFEADDQLLVEPALSPDFIYLDNTFELSRRGKNTALNALYYKAITVMAEFARILEFSDEADEYEAFAEQLRKKFLDIFSHEKYEKCFYDNNIRSDKMFYMVNFSCELGHWSGSCGVLELLLEADKDCSRILEYADYAGIRIYVNGTTLVDKERKPTWARQPMYDAESLPISLNKGINRLQFEVLSNELNWELFFRFDSELDLRIIKGSVRENNWATGQELSESKEIRIRRWIAPVLSQSTHGYVGIAGIHKNAEDLAIMLKHLIRESYPRVYKSVRVPSFCPEAGGQHEEDEWVMPANTPWSTFFLLTSLFENGCQKEGLKIIRDYWHDMVASGAVNTWEEWGNRSSLCHAWGAVPIHFMQKYILGVHHDTINKGYILIRPQLFDLDFAEGCVALINSDKIYVKMERKDAETLLTVVAPETVKIKLDMSLLEGVLN